MSGAVRNFPEFASFRESSRRKALKTRGVALLSEGSRAPFSGKFPDGGPNGTRWQLLWYWAYLDVPRSGHADVIEMDGSEAGVGRRKVFVEALDIDPAVLKARSLQPADHRIEPDRLVKNVIFVIHGIRDEGYWTQKIARRVMDRWRKGGRDRRFASVTGTYGYYTLLPFLFPWRRREKVRWLMD